MPRYAGDQILQGGDNVSTTALNYRKTDRSSNFGTRKLAFYSIQMSPDFDLAANYADNNSLYYQIVRAIQQGGTIGGIDAPYEGNGTIRGGGGGGAELFYVGTPQNSATSPLNQQDNWYGVKPTFTTDDVTVITASGTGTVATLTFDSAQSTPPFNVGDPIEVSNIGSGYNCHLYDQQFVISCSTTQVTYNSSATATLTGLEGSVYADLGFDCFTFAVVDDAEPFLPEGSGYFNNTDYSGVAGDVECYCDDGRAYTCVYPYNFGQAISNVLVANQLPYDDYNIFRLKDSFGLLAF